MKETAIVGQACQLFAMMPKEQLELRQSYRRWR